MFCFEQCLKYDAHVILNSEIGKVSKYELSAMAVTEGMGESFDLLTHNTCSLFIHSYKYYV